MRFPQHWYWVILLNKMYLYLNKMYLLLRLGLGFGFGLLHLIMHNLLLIL